MKLLVLHDFTNPERIVPIDPDSFAMAAPYLSGGLVYTKDREGGQLVYETPERIAELIGAL
jgi:hypothetical protein